MIRVPIPDETGAWKISQGRPTALARFDVSETGCSQRRRRVGARVVPARSCEPQRARSVVVVRKERALGKTRFVS
jgi:hypothetical protein